MVLLRKQTTVVALTIGVLAATLGALPAHAGPWDNIRAWETARVQRVVDGDTIIVRDVVTNAKSRIRLLGINSPEKDTALHSGWCGGWQAMDVLAEMLPKGTTVRLLSADQNSQGKGRPQRVVLAQNPNSGEFDLDLAWAMAERGWAHWYTKRTEASMSALYRRAIESAQQRKVGIWNPGLCGELEQPDARIDLRIARASTTNSVNEEWVQVRNSGASPVDLSGWTLRDAGNQAWKTLPVGTILAPGDYRIVHTGSGESGLPAGQDLYRGHSKLLYPEPGKAPNLVGDGAYLLDRFGNYRFWREYPCTSRCENAAALEAITFSEISLGRGKGKKRSQSQYLRLLNQGSTQVCLDGYAVKTDAFEYRIPAGACLAPGSTWTLHGGRGPSDSFRINLNRKKPIMYLQGTATLVSDREAVVATRNW